MSSSREGGYTLSLPGFDEEAPAYPDLFAEASPAPAVEAEAPQIELERVPMAWRPALAVADLPLKETVTSAPASAFPQIAAARSRCRIM